MDVDVGVDVQVDWVTMNFVPFSERALDMVVELYREACSHPTVIKAHVLQNILKVSPARPSLCLSCLSVYLSVEVYLSEPFSL